MSKQTKEIHIHFTLTPEKVQAFLALLVIAAFPEFVGSETVTLQTYYPAPYGIYSQLRTTEQTSLAEGASYVTRIGLAATYTEAPAGTEPKLHVLGKTRLQGDTVIYDKAGAGTTAYTAWVNMDNPGGNHNVSTAQDIRMGVNGRLSVQGYIHNTVSSSSCSSLVGQSSCSGTTYATWIPGIFQEGYTSGSWPQPKSEAYYGGGQTEKFQFLVRDPGNENTQSWTTWNDFVDLKQVAAYCCPR